MTQIQNRAMSKQLHLFDEPTLGHDPRGRVRIALSTGTRGDARFSACGRYRQVLRRWIGESFPERYWLLIGMNPSTADATVDDPTVRREWGFTLREGYTGFVKCNVGDFRATFPADLSAPDVVACSPENLPAILAAAADADRVVVCHGKLPRPLVAPAGLIVQALRDGRANLFCFGRTKDGFPRHPLYLRRDTPLEPMFP